MVQNRFRTLFFKTGHCSERANDVGPVAISVGVHCSSVVRDRVDSVNSRP